MKINKKILISVGALIFGLLIWRAFFHSPEAVDNSTVEDTSEQEAMIDPNATQGSDESLNKGPAVPDASSVEPPVDPAQVQAQFLEALKGLGTCLEIKNAIDTEQKEIKLDSLVASVRNEIGDPVIRSEDWSNTLLDMADGEQRRIRIEMEYDTDDKIVKRLKYYKIQNDQMVPIPLENDVAVDPQDSFIASLESDGKIFMREKGSRIYFQNGEELIFVERNDQLSDIEMNRNGRTFKCTALDSGKSHCSCM